MNPNDHYHHHHHQHHKPATPAPINPHHPSHEHNNLINGIGPGGGVSAFSAAGISHAGHSPGSGSAGLFFPANSFLQVGHKPPSADSNCITLEAMLNSSKQLNSSAAAPLQLVDFKDVGVEARHGTSADHDHNMMLKSQATRFFRSNSNNTMYDQAGGGLGDDMSMQDYNLMDQDGDYDGVGGGDKKLGAIGSGRRLGYDQVKALEKAFEVENRLEPERKMRLASQLGLQPRQVAVWFQNRRARWKTKQMERDYTLLKNKFEALKADRDKLLQEKDNLQAEIMRLKGQPSNETKQPGDQDSPTLASCSLVDDAANQAHVGEENIDNTTPDDLKVENGSLSSTEGSDNINGDIEDSSSNLQTNSSSLKPINEEPDFHWKQFNPQPQAIYSRNNVKNEEWENGEQNTFNMSMEWPYNW